jgi:hypothetical protein
MYGYLLNRLVELGEILYGCDIVWDRDVITFNPIASTILKYSDYNLCGGCITCTIQHCSAMGWDCLAFLGFHGYITHRI